MSDTTDYGSGQVAGSIRRIGPGRTRRLIKKGMTADTLLTTLPGLLLGWNMRETTGSAGAVVELYDGNTAQGEFTGTVGNASGVSTVEWFGPEGIEIQNGVFAHVVTGTMDVIVYFRADMQGA